MIIGKANISCEVISGGVSIAAIKKAITIKQRRNFLSFVGVTTLSALNKMTATGTSKVIPNAKNMCSTKLI